MNKFLRFSFLLTIFPILLACSQKPLSTKEILDQVYPFYDAKHSCWIATEPNGGRYCMKIDTAKKLTLKDGERMYLLASGEIVDDAGEPNGAHMNVGMVGAFITETRNGKSTVLASNPYIYVGSSGSGPRDWALMKLGTADYWGWQNTSGDCHQGYCGSYYSILAPYGKSIRDIASVVSQFDDSGACYGTTTDENSNEVEVNCDEVSSSLQTTLKVDSTNSYAKVYPLLITLTGKEKGKKIAPKTWVFNFDDNNWNYQVPKDYPLADKDF